MRLNSRCWSHFMSYKLFYQCKPYYCAKFALTPTLLPLLPLTYCRNDCRGTHPFLGTKASTTDNKFKKFAIRWKYKRCRETLLKCKFQVKFSFCHKVIWRRTCKKFLLHGAQPVRYIASSAANFINIPAKLCVAEICIASIVQNWIYVPGADSSRFTAAAIGFAPRRQRVTYANWEWQHYISECLERPSRGEKRARGR